MEKRDCDHSTSTDSVLTRTDALMVYIAFDRTEQHTERMVTIDPTFHKVLASLLRLPSSPCSSPPSAFSTWIRSL